MNKDQVKGAVDDTVGRAKRQAGEWTGDPDAQLEGAAQQVKGKAEKAWGNIKDAANDANADLHQRQNEARRSDSAAVDHSHQTSHKGH